jgi:hypothetical protein
MSNSAKKQVVTEETASMTVVKNHEQETVPPAESVTIVPEVEVVPELSLEEKIQRIEDLTVLIDKRKKLQESRRSLQSFKVAADGFSNQLSIHDLTSHSEFKTFNAAVITRVMDVIKSSVDEKLAEIESQIKF